MAHSAASTLTEIERADIERANVSGRQPVVFVHGLWLLSSSWDRWRALFEDAGYTTVAPSWPDDPPSIEAARSNPDAFASKMVQEVTDHYLEAIAELSAKPAVVGHSFGGLIAQKIAGEGASAATVAVDPAPFQGVLSVPLSSLKSSAPVVGHLSSLKHGVTLSFEDFQYGWANALDEDEARALYEEFHVAAAGNPIFQVVTANLNPFSETKVDTKNPDRGPLLLIAGEEDHTVPVKPTEQSYAIQSKNPGVTEFVVLPSRGHSLTIDHGWREVADTAISFIERFARSAPDTAG
ncbi:alpha/beta hydrolase [Microbacterium ulmi]|uniref:Alpha/beta hydrolase n=1 Tax=Microbacterium ulmi TaxID=179095 RepID=A0A7Y2LX29_9MICO|nr:alpha/beta hydrolase [Microbacterium ulmi]NII71109.1 pimeloyl-ACP methyl ester carboxylesterase [Microbacterium ulmi]NNH02416.1 alpha/beta hydrolase [Microbacterium ulmi]